MAIIYGLTTGGFNTKPAAVILADIQAAIRAILGEQLQLDTLDPIGGFIGVQSQQLGQIWNLALALYNALDRDAAEGTLLENLCELVGTNRLAATEAVGEVTCTGIAAIVIPAGSIVRVPSGARFSTDDDATIGGGGTVNVAITAVDTGAVSISPGGISEIVTPVSGWMSVTNALAINDGTDLETDLELRTRVRASFQGLGAGTEGAIRERVLANASVEACVVVSNRTMVIVGTRPPKSFETIVWPNTLGVADEKDVALRIFREMPAGIYSHGTEVYTIVDLAGYSQTVRFSYATQIEVNTVIVVEKAAGFPTDGEDRIKAAVEAVYYGGVPGDYYAEATDETPYPGLSIGDDVPYPLIYSAIDKSCPGIYDIDLTLNATTNPVVITETQIGALKAWGAGSSVTLI